MQLPPTVTERAFARLSEIGAGADGKALRIAVEGGGCSGFQYEIKLDAPTGEDLVIKASDTSESVIVDPVSLPFLSGAVIDFADELIGARFTIENPNATSSCGCGTSFSM
jgi:iron-sulfur cluster assembly accessory protein